MYKDLTLWYVDPIIEDLCKHFAELVVNTNVYEYARRKQFNKSKIINDIFLGKLAEFGVYYILKQRGIFQVTPPDLRVYGKTLKSFDSDLQADGEFLHIKTQSKESSDRYGHSWVFQSNDPIVNNATPKDWFIGTSIYKPDDQWIVDIQIEKPANQLIFNKPILDKFTNKTCVYLKDNL
jgi:hypothetical protein